MLSSELYKVIKRTKKRGFSEGLQYIRGQIYSTSKYYVFRHNMNNIPDASARFDKFQFVKIDDSDSELFHELYRVWSPETRPDDSKYMTELIQERSKYDVMCFVLLDGKKIVGANWISRPNHYYLSLGIPFLPDEYVSYWTFIVSNYRNMGASVFIKSNSLRIAKQRGITSAARKSRGLRKKQQCDFGPSRVS